MNESAEATPLHLTQNQNFKIASSHSSLSFSFSQKFRLSNVFNLSRGRGNKTSTNAV